MPGVIRRFDRLAGSMPPAGKDEGVAFLAHRVCRPMGQPYARFRKGQDFGQPAAGKSMGKCVIAVLPLPMRNLIAEWLVDGTFYADVTAITYPCDTKRRGSLDAWGG